MKLTAILLLTACLTASAGGYGQITLSEKNVPLFRVLKKIERQSGYEFLCPKDLAQKVGNVSVVVHDAGISEVLQLILTGRKLSFFISDKTIIIREAEQLPAQKELPQPPIDIKGRIVNEKGEGVVATIVVKGTQNGTTSSADGFFELKNVDEDATLIISGVSIESSEIKIKGRTALTISTVTKIAAQEEVTIRAGYYDVKKREATGNISKVSAMAIEKQPVSNPIAALHGRVPGLEVVQTNGVPGGSFKVRIRGTNSIANGNEPLFIIDGVPYMSTSMNFRETSGSILTDVEPGVGGSSPLNSINPLDIESIEVLKDADATAIYGSRGANGVILITTKRGRPGKTRVDFNYYAGSGKVTRKMELLNLRQYLDMRYEAYGNDGIDFTQPGISAMDLKVWDTTHYTDWQKELIGGTAKYTDAQVTVSGGEQNTQFSLGSGYHRETAVFPGNNADQRISVHGSISNTSLNRKLKTSFTFNYAVNSTDLLNQDLTSLLFNFSPNAPALYDANGNLSWTGWSYPNFEHPLVYLKRRYEATRDNLVGSALVSYSILPSLDIKANLGYTNSTMKATTLTPKSSYDPADVPFVQNVSAFSNSSFRNWVIEPQLNWKPGLGSGMFDILVGATFLEQHDEGLAQSAYGFSSEGLMKNLGAATIRVTGTNYYSQYRYNAVFGRINYNLDRKYIINITGRRDGSSRFGPGKQFANFGAAGIAWIFSKENFIEKAFPYLSFGKLRASYGTSGNDQIGDYQYLDAYTSSGVYQGGVGLRPVRLSNPDFAWEINKKMEAAVELGFVQDRIMLAVSWYRNRSSSQLVGYPLAPTTGFASIQGNFPATVQNTGIEIEVNSRNIQDKELTWTTSFNISIPRNKLVAFPGMETFPAYASKYIVGEPLSIIRLYHFTGLNTASGIFEFEDVDGNGSYDFRDQQAVKFVGYSFFGGLQNSFSYKGFQLDFLFQFVKQTGWDALLNLTGSFSSAVPAYMLERWQKSGDNTPYQRLGVQAPVTTAASLYSSSDQVIGDASFIRLKNLAFSWALPRNWMNKVQAEKARLFIQGQNLLTITRYKGLDPERAGGYMLPPLKVITAGIQFTF